MAANVPASLGASLSDRVLYLATCWLIIRTDGTTHAFTNHNKRLTLFGLFDFTPMSGLSTSAVQKKGGLRTVNAEYRGIIDMAGVSEDDMRAGAFRDARIIEYLVDWRCPWAGYVIAYRYWVTETRFNGEFWEAQVGGFAERMRRPVGELFQRSCRWTLGDAFCTVDVAGTYRESFTVTSVPQDRLTFRASAMTSHVDHYWAFGQIIWQTGTNGDASRRSEIKDSQDSVREITLADPAPYPIEVGDTGLIDPGCNKTISTCVGKYNNLVNFGGFPTIPGPDKMLRTPDDQDRKLIDFIIGLVF